MTSATSAPRRPALVLVPGLNCTADLFGPQIAAFGDHVGVGHRGAQSAQTV